MSCSLVNYWFESARLSYCIVFPHFLECYERSRSRGKSFTSIVVCDLVCKISLSTRESRNIFVYFFESLESNAVGQRREISLLSLLLRKTYLTADINDRKLYIRTVKLCLSEVSGIFKFLFWTHSDFTETRVLSRFESVTPIEWIFTDSQWVSLI